MMSTLGEDVLVAMERRALMYANQVSAGFASNNSIEYDFSLVVPLLVAEVRAQRLPWNRDDDPQELNDAATVIAHLQERTGSLRAELEWALEVITSVFLQTVPSDDVDALAAAMVEADSTMPMSPNTWDDLMDVTREHYRDQARIGLAQAMFRRWNREEAQHYYEVTQFVRREV